jgi:hypothetical protein
MAEQIVYGVWGKYRHAEEDENATLLAIFSSMASAERFMRTELQDGWIYEYKVRK